MDNNIVVTVFKVESEAYQALTQLKQNPGDEKSFVSSAVLVKKEETGIRTLDWFDTGSETMNDTAIGGLIGALFGILGGPLGVLLGSSYGALIGAMIDSGDAVQNISLLEQIVTKLEDGEVAIIGLVREENEAILDEKLSGFETVIARFDAASVAQEIEEAEELEREMALQARRELRNDKKASRKGKREMKKAKLEADMEAALEANKGKYLSDLA